MAVGAMRTRATTGPGEAIEGEGGAAGSGVAQKAAAAAASGLGKGEAGTRGKIGTLRTENKRLRTPGSILALTHIAREVVKFCHE